jgi:hypothetical protein
MRAFERRRVRTFLLSGLSALAMACAASLTFADPRPRLGPSGADLRAGAPMLSPEAPSFGDPAAASPLLAVFDAAGRARDSSRESSLFAEPKLDLASSAAPPRQGPVQPDNVVYDPTVGPSLSPTQSALKASLERLVTRDDHRDPLGSGDWRAARGAIAAFYAGRNYTPVWVSENTRRCVWAKMA